ncbi:DUF2269 family protein [Euzebya sp.]|uniref:DUF2269 family protein n=1 Tax=Euzebya sp. TaxID=1971409 RepID=UPI0035151E9D
MYETLKFIHVMAVIAWFGGGIFLTALAGRAARTDTAALGTVVRLGGAMGPFFGAMGGIAFLAGIAMVLTTDGLDFEEAWITIGIVVYLVSAFLGGRVLGPRYERLGEAAAGGDAAATETARKAVVSITMVDLTLLTIAVAAMVFKWGA